MKIINHHFLSKTFDVSYVSVQHNFLYPILIYLYCLITDFLRVYQYTWSSWLKRGKVFFFFPGFESLSPCCLGHLCFCAGDEMAHYSRNMDHKKLFTYVSQEWEEREGHFTKSSSKSGARWSKLPHYTLPPKDPTISQLYKGESDGLLFINLTRS